MPKRASSPSDEHEAERMSSMTEVAEKLDTEAAKVGKEVADLEGLLLKLKEEEQEILSRMDDLTGGEGGNSHHHHRHHHGHTGGEHGHHHHHHRSVEEGDTHAAGDKPKRRGKKK